MLTRFPLFVLALAACNVHAACAPGAYPSPEGQLAAITMPASDAAGARYALLDGQRGHLTDSTAPFHCVDDELREGNTVWKQVALKLTPTSFRSGYAERAIVGAAAEQHRCAATACICSRFGEDQPYWDCVSVPANCASIPQHWVLAEADSVAPSAPTIARLQRLRNSGGDIHIAVFPNTDHGIHNFTVAPDGARKDAGVASGYFRLLADWAKGVSSPRTCHQVFSQRIAPCDRSRRAPTGRQVGDLQRARLRPGRREVPGAQDF